MDRPSGTYGEGYYVANGQAGDRPALGWYVRMVRRYIGGEPFLDFGCGTGHLVRRLSRHGGASGYEISAYSAAVARGNAPNAQIHELMETLPAGHYSAITAIHVIEHLTDEQVDDALACWRRILKSDGRVLVVTPDLDGRGRRLAGPRWTGFQDQTHINLKGHQEWRRLFESAGWSVVREGSDGLWNVPYGRLPKIVEAVHRAVPALFQYLAGRLLLRPGTGESAVFVVERTRRGDRADREPN